MRFAVAFTALPLVLWSTTALATPATPEGAAALVAMFQTYLGTTDGVVAVTALGEAYDVTLDFAPMIAAMPDQGAEATISPIEFALVDNGDGTWEMTQDQAFAMILKVPGELDMSLTMAKWAGTGTFDTTLQAFVTSASEVTDLALNQTMTDPTAGQSTVAYTIDTMIYSSSAVAGAAGGVDSKSTYVVTGLAEDFSLPGMGEGGTPTQLKLTAESYTAEAAVSGMRPDAMYKLLAFFVANPSEAAITAQQDGLKTIVRDGVPLFDNILSTGAITSVSVATPMGDFGLDSMGIVVEANGVVADGKFREGITMSGLTMPEGLVPAWAVPLVPESVALEFTVSRFNVAAPVALFLETVDLATGPVDSAEMNAKMMAAFLPEGLVDITIAPGSIVGADYELTYQAVITAGVDGAPPTGTAKVTAAGLEAVQTALAAAPPEMGGQIAPILGIAQGMAKPGAEGELIWDLEMTPAGGMLVNGVDLMGGGQ